MKSCERECECEPSIAQLHPSGVSATRSLGTGESQLTPMNRPKTLRWSLLVVRAPTRRLAQTLEAPFKRNANKSQACTLTHSFQAVFPPLLYMYCVPSFGFLLSVSADSLSYTRTDSDLVLVAGTDVEFDD